jgi:hypothetical protein
MRMTRETPRLVLPYALLLVMAAFFVVPSSKAINNVFYAVVIPLLLASVTRDDFKAYHGSPLTNLWFAFVVFIPFNQFWMPEFEASELTRALRRVVYLYVLGLAVFIMVRDRRTLEWLVIPGIAVLAAMNGAVAAALIDWRGGIPDERLFGMARMHNPQPRFQKSSTRTLPA